MKIFSLPRFTVSLLVIAVLITFSLFRLGRANATSTSGVRCGALGTYGFTGFGNTFTGNPLGFDAGVVSSNGTITLGADGKWFVHEFEVVNGVVAHGGNPAEYTGEYTVNTDCDRCIVAWRRPGPGWRNCRPWQATAGDVDYSWCPG